MIKLVALDMDGTLLNSNKQVPKENIDTIREYKEKGIMFAFCTGRVMNEIELVSDELPDVDYAVTCNGSLVYDISDRKNYKLIYGNTISMDEVRAIYKFIEDLGVDMMFELQADGVVYASKYCIDNPDKYGADYIRDLIKETRIPVEDIKEYIDEREEDVGKLNIFFPDAETRFRVLDELKNIDYDCAYSEPTNIDINQKGSDKAVGLKKLMEHLNLMPEEVLAIGEIGRAHV